MNISRETSVKLTCFLLRQLLGWLTVLTIAPSAGEQREFTSITIKIHQLLLIKRWTVTVCVVKRADLPESVGNEGARLMREANLANDASSANQA